MDELPLILIFYNLAKAYADSAASAAGYVFTDDGNGNITITKNDS